MFHRKRSAPTTTSVLTTATVTAFALLVPCNLIQSRTSKQSNVVRLSLAGVRVGHMGNMRGKYDPKQGYYLIELQECDGAHKHLLLTPDPAEAYLEAEQIQRLARVHLPRLRTGKGVNIGETPAQVQHKLGKAPDFYSYDRVKKERVYEYRATLPKQRRGRKQEKSSYRGVYKFRNERLRSITYNLDIGDGCL